MNQNPTTDYRSLPEGCHVTDHDTSFLLYAPQAQQVKVQLWEDAQDYEPSLTFSLKSESDGNWWTLIQHTLDFQWYNYRIEWEDSDSESYFPDELSDPHSKELTVFNNYLQPSKSKLLPSGTFDWGNDDFKISSNHLDLIIYETHIHDLVALSDPAIKKRGTYNSFIADDHNGGLTHLKKMGVNTVEFLPLQQFAYFEPPYKQTAQTSQLTNNWNPYTTNYWGYMPSHFFAVDTRYASDGNKIPDSWSGNMTKASNEFKRLVKTLHQEGINVIVDMVFNHVSHHDLNPLRYLSPYEYLRYSADGQLSNKSGCGNDFKSESQKGRDIILNAVKHWMLEYHVDGFRFDLAHLLDWETVAQIREVASSINPNAILIAEPWGGGYNPMGFSNLGWSSWNDQFRDGIRGINEKNQLGIGFGKWNRKTTSQKFTTLLQASLQDLPQGISYEAQHTVNYLDCHDGYTLGDFIRRSLRDPSLTYPVNNVFEYVRYSKREQQHAKLMAMLLLLSPGIPMLQAGQEWGRAKIIRPTSVPEPKVGFPDSNSYNKDNETNYLNFEHIESNPELFRFYQKLISIRKKYPELRMSDSHRWDIHEGESALQRVFYFNNQASNSTLCWLINADPTQKLKWSDSLKWEILISSLEQNNINANSISTLEVFPLSSVLLRKLRD